MRKSTSIDKLRNDTNLESYSKLALAIVAHAVDDAMEISPGEIMAKTGYLVTPWELLNFFRSQWCGVLLAQTSLSGDDFIEMTELERKCKL